MSLSPTIAPESFSPHAVSYPEKRSAEHLFAVAELLRFDIFNVPAVLSEISKL